MKIRRHCSVPPPILRVGILLYVAFVAARIGLASDHEPASTDLNWAKEREFWAFRPPVASRPPEVHNARWPRQPLDFFILSRLEENGLSPSLEASRRTLIRRLSFDLIGLPPTPEEVDVFLGDPRTDAYERLVDRLLASPRFGERMASLWLPLARYAEDQAHQVGDDTKYFYPNAWRYRAWIIDAFNQDLPYDEFLRLQLAADRIEGTNSPNLAALGFLGLGPKYYNRDRLEVQADEWEDRVDTVSRAMLGLTVACARCHDHKFEPITMRDYYAMAGVFASTRMVNRRPDGAAEKNDTQATNMSSAVVHVVEDTAEPKNLPVFLRGNPERKGPEVARQFLRVLSESGNEPFQHGSGRLELADAIARPTNPLTARVIVNRVWGQFFGRPLVATPSNFGHSGQPPTHPQLLDDLAVRFMHRGWSMKWIAREIVLSSAYRQTSHRDAGVLSAPSGANQIEKDSSAEPDVENELLGRMNRRRLSVEQWRDALLFAAGELDYSGGRSLELDDPANLRRTVHARVSRLKLNDLLIQFDYPDANVHAEQRGTTTTATQKLFALNSPFIAARAVALVARLTRDPDSTDAARVKQAYQILFAREPMPEELDLGVEFLMRPGRNEASRWTQYAQMLLASNEMLYVD